MKKIILFLFPLVLISCNSAPTQQVDNTAPAMISSEAGKTTPPKAHKAAKSTAQPETQQAAKELDNLIDEIAKSK